MLLSKLGRLVFTICMAGAAYGQLTRGFISGTVQDPSGALVTGVKITISNVETNLKRDAETNSVGVYRFVAVEPGFYDLEFTKAGFETTKVTRIEVSTTREVVVNETLGVAGVASTIQVQEAPPGVTLEKTTATLDRKLDSHTVEMIPTTSGSGGTLPRDVTRLALMAPLAVRATGSLQISVNGQRARNNNLVIDGVDNNDVSVSRSNVRIVPE